MPVTQGFHIEEHILVNIAGGDEIPVDGMGQTSAGHGFRRGNDGLGDHLAAIDAPRGEIQAFPIDVGMVPMRGRGAKLQHLHQVLQRCHRFTVRHSRSFLHARRPVR